MLGEIFRNIVTKKPSLPYPEGFRLSPEEEVIVDCRKGLILKDNESTYIF